jgi:hypothetical protein
VLWGTQGFVGHFLPEEAPDLTSAALADFID